MRGLFVTGTGTGVGKTYVCCRLLESLRGSRVDVAPFKPVCCGDREDPEKLLAASGRADLTKEEVNPFWLRTPAAPLAGAMIEGREVSMDNLCVAAEKLAARSRMILVEGVGGWRVPLTETEDMDDLAVRLGLDVLVVAANQLGTINHTLLTVEAIRNRGLKCLGVILNYPGEERDAASISNRLLLEKRLRVPILAECMHGETILDTEWAVRRFS